MARSHFLNIPNEATTAQLAGLSHTRGVCRRHNLNWEFMDDESDRLDLILPDDVLARLGEEARNRGGTIRST
jgi:hypothetical protein